MQKSNGDALKGCTNTGLEIQKALSYLDDVEPFESIHQLDSIVTFNDKWSLQNKKIYTKLLRELSVLFWFCIKAPPV